MAQPEQDGAQAESVQQQQTSGRLASAAPSDEVAMQRLGSVLPWTIWVAPLVLPALAGGVALAGLLLGLWAYGQPYSSDDAVWRVGLVLSATIAVASVGGSLFLLALNGYFMRVAVSPRLAHGGHLYRTPRARKREHEPALRLRYTPGILELVDGNSGELRAACVIMLEFAYDGKRSLDERFGALLAASKALDLVLEVRVPAADPNAEVCHDYDPRRMTWVPGTELE